MVVEIIAGLAFGSMALLADGLHMASHAGALGITAAAYLFARRFAKDRRFTFGTGKLGELAGFASALLLAVMAVAIAVESVTRFFEPIEIRFDEAIAVAFVGLVVNLLSAWLLMGGGEKGGHGHSHSHGHSHGHAHEDHNLRAAYFHVLADALTSLLAIAALFSGRLFGWVWMDPLMGIVGSILIARWSWGLMKGAGAVLLDTVPDPALPEQVKQAIETDSDDRVFDLHLWRVGPGHVAAILSVVSDRPQSPDYYRGLLTHIVGLSHVTVEVHLCEGHAKTSDAQ